MANADFRLFWMYYYMVDITSQCSVGSIVSVEGVFETRHIHFVKVWEVTLEGTNLSENTIAWIY